MAEDKDKFINVKLRESEILEIKDHFEYLKHTNGATTDEGKYCTKLINRFKKALKK
jgi:hypothetical protein